MSGDTLKDALALAERGYHVFPCKSDKTPCTANGFHDASADSAAIRAMWAARPGPLIGIATGKVSGIAVLDVDCYKPSGQDWVEKYLSRIPATYGVETKNGGAHFYFQHRAGLRSSANKIAERVDVRADGGYVIYWPAAGRHVFDPSPLAPWPSWLDELLNDPTAMGVAPDLSAPTPDALKGVDLESLAAIVRLLPNDKTFDSREKWVGLAHALAAAFADKPWLAEELWLEHAAKRHQAEGAPERVWETLGESHRVGADYIVSVAQSAGIDVSAYVHASAAAAFAAAPLQIEATHTRTASVTSELNSVMSTPPQSLPLLMVQGHDRPATVRELREVLARAPDLFDRGGVPVLLIRQAGGGLRIARALTFTSVIYEAHRYCQPAKRDPKGRLERVTLPDAVARMYLDRGEWGLRPLAGVSSAPLLAEGGGILHNSGYDAETQTWCEAVPRIEVPLEPSRQDADEALARLRAAFKTFPFADAKRIAEGELLVVDLSSPAASSESSFLAALLTAVCRPSLRLAPGVLIIAPEVSGAGAGKGLLARAICSVAYGVQPAAFTPGHDRNELDKRLVAELIGAAPAMLLDNCNSTALRSDTLASILTERPARVRLMGVSEMVPLNSSAFMAITGNGLSVSEDLARRFLTVNLDPQCEDPEARPFRAGFLDNIRAQRADLLGAALTIWRWGQQNVDGLTRGLPLGSFEAWAVWVRDPLLSLGCTDPIQRVRAAKANDPRRRAFAELFEAWWQHHGDRPVKAADLNPAVLQFINPQGRGRQYVAQRLLQMSGTRAGGFVLVQQPPAGKWTAATYALAPAESASVTESVVHRIHRTHRGDAAATGPMGPMRHASRTPEDVDAGAFAAVVPGRAP